jgi:hypothetical protein
MAGFVDFYFSKNFSRPVSRQNKLRNFDVAENQFALSLAELVFRKEAGPIGFRIDAAFGTANDLVQNGNASTLNNLQQAYLTAVVPVGSGLTVDVGRFVTHMGYEVIESQDNWNYSRSLLFSWAIPYHHIGLRTRYPLSDNVSVAGYLYNGWNRLVDNNSGKTLGASVILTPVGGLSLFANWIGGPELDDSVSGGQRNVVDATVVLETAAGLTLALNADYGTERIRSGAVDWKGVAAYIRYGLGDNLVIAIRGEVFLDRDGVSTGIPQDLKELTLTVEHRFLQHLLLRAEYRHDRSTSEVFDDRSGVGLLNHQNTIAIGSVITF